MLSKVIEWHLCWQIGALDCEYYKDDDLKIGVEINVFGRKFTLFDCDDFTKEYYKVKYGISK